VRESGSDHEAGLAVEPEDVLGEWLIDDGVALGCEVGVVEIELRDGRALCCAGFEEAIDEERAPVERGAFAEVDGEGLGHADDGIGCAAGP